MKHSSFLFLSLALVAGLGAAPAAAQKYVAVGDSITFGFGDDGPDEEMGYPSRLEKLLVTRGESATVANRGISGETTAEALSRINNVLAGDFEELLLMEGTNDVNARLSPETIRFNLEKIGQRAIDRNVKVTIGTVIPRLPTANFDSRNQITRRLAEEIRGLAHDKGWPLADLFDVFITTPNVFGLFYGGNGDNLHPNGVGYDAMALTFADVLTETDTRPPVTGIVTPGDDSVNVPTSFEVSVEVFDFGTGLDPTATALLVNDEVVPATITGDSKRQVLTYRPEGGFRGAPEVRLRARDTAVPVHSFDAVVTRFTVKGAVFLPGDITRNGRVDGEDLVLLARSFGSTIGETRYLFSADFNGDGEVDGRDLAVLAGNFGKVS